MCIKKYEGTIDMTEISKAFKIFMIVAGAIALFYGIWWTFLTGTYYDMVGWVHSDPSSVRGQGGTLIILGIFNCIAALRIEWEKMKFYVQFAFGWLIIMLILNFVNFFDPLVPAAQLLVVWINIAFLSAIIVLLIYFYTQQEKKP